MLASRFQGLAGTRKRGCCVANGLDNLFVDIILEQGRQTPRPMYGNTSGQSHRWCKGPGAIHWATRALEHPVVSKHN